MPEFDLDLDEISTLFAEAAVALRATQQSLDAVRLPVPYAGALDVLTYAVPRADFEIKAQLQKINTKVFFIFKKNRRAEVDRHITRFTLLAVPDAPLPPSLSTLLPPAPPTPASGIPPPVPLPPFEFAMPPFLLTVSEERGICRNLAALLRNAKAGDYEDKLPPGEPLKPEDVNTEGVLLGSDCEKLQPDPNDDYQPGSIFFRLDGASPSTLVVRATKDAEDVGVYVYRPDARPPVAVYSVFNDDTKALSYEPIQLLLDALRGWREGGAARREAHMAVDPQVGLKFLPRVLHAVWNGYLDALNQLHSPSSPPAASPPGDAHRSFFDLPGVEAHLSYAAPQLLPSDDGGATSKGDDDEAPEHHVIETRARLRVERRSGRAACMLSLDAAEFVLTGASRDFVIEMIRKQAEKIADKFASDEPEPYLRALRGEELRRDGVILLTSSEKIPKPHFLVVCPGTMASVVQDFMFKCELKVDKDGSRLENIDDVRPMRHVVQLVGEQPIQPDLSFEQYKHWHGFFKAVRRWRTRREPPVG
jgi:hypothetical protein